jgi:ADP-L-glycero-D-manno-heptose 6-epimerase|tara:strand:- start:4582 stop:5574 length:993 start_codon:yes stop_codon:yes gene_type:complete
MNFNNKTILITGGAGFIGSNLVFYFQEYFPESHIVVFDCFRNNNRFTNGNLLSFGHFSNLIGFKGDVICGNINSKDDLRKLQNYKFDYIFHQAAISDTRIYDQEIIMETNVNSFYDILELSNKNNAVLVYASSAATYGNSASPQVIGKENPQNPYGFSKYMMDQIACRYANTHKHVLIVGLRFFNVFGPRETYKEKTSSMILQLGHQILKNNPPKLFKNSENILRDFIYIEDVIQANILACETQKSGVYNVGTALPRSFKDVADVLLKEFNSSLSIEYFENPYSDYQNHTQADISLTQKDLGFEPNVTLEKGIKLYSKEIIRTLNITNND